MIQKCKSLLILSSLLLCGGLIVSAGISIIAVLLSLLIIFRCVIRLLKHILSVMFEADGDSVHDAKKTTEYSPLIEGRYELISELTTSDYQEYLVAMEYADEHLKAMRSLRPVVLTVAKEGSTWTYQLRTRVKTMEVQFQSGVEFDEELLDKRKVKSVAVVKENIFQIQKLQRVDDKFDARQIATFSKEGVRIRYSVKGKSTELNYKRINSDSVVPAMSRISG